MGSTDYLESPSSRLVVGRPVLSGTGAFDVLASLTDTRVAADAS